MSLSVPAGIEAAEAAFLAGDLDRVEALCRALLHQDEGHLQACHLLGALALRRRAPQEAADWLEKALSGGLTNPVVLNNCGEAYRQLGRLDEAYVRFEQALRMDNLNPYPHFNLGLLMRDRGQAREAEHFFRSALIAAPGMARAHYELAELYREEGHRTEAEREYREAIAMLTKPGDKRDAGAAEDAGRWAVRLGSMLLERGAPREAIVVLRDALARDEALAPARLALARAQFELCWERDSEAAYRQAVAIQPALALHNPPRVLSALITQPQAWCDRGHGRYTRLARAQWLALSPFKAIPEAFAKAFLIGVPMMPELFSVRLDQAEVMPADFSVLSDGRFFVDGFVNWAQHYPQKGHYARHSTDDLRVLLDLPARVKEYDGACVLLGRDGGHYAWMFETLARLWAIEQQPDLAKLPLVVPVGLSASRLAMLEGLGIGGERLLVVEDDCTLRVAELHVPSLLTVGDWVSPLALQHLRRRFSGDATRVRRRIYLSRRGAADRRLANEIELQPVLERHGFETIDVENISLAVLLEILGSAEAVLSIDDEALAALVVVPQKARVGVIATGGTYRPRAYFISGQLAHDFHYLGSEVVFESNPAHALCDVILPPATLDAFLKDW